MRILTPLGFGNGRKGLEGAAEALSTFRSAADFCEEFDGFVFNHNEAVLYKWVQKYEPELFRRIKKLVKAQKWNIMGGWYLQPDCNMPSGESFVRQILLGRNYFKKEFGVDVTTAINFDPFGHTRGLVQILAKSGYDSYLFCRPEQEYCPLISEDFYWIGYDGSKVMARRFSASEGFYNNRLGEACEKIKKWIDNNRNKQIGVILWGVGNHGGGASRVDLRKIGKLIQETKDFNLIHSTPQKYFQNLRQQRQDLPKVKRDLNPWATGCYTSMIRIKQKHRLLENEIYSLEKMASAASCQGFIKYPYEQIHEAVCDLVLLEFHDILPGSSIQPVEESALQLAGHGLEIASRLKAQAFFALAKGQKAVRPGEIPILVYNPHPFKIKQTFECEFNLADISVDKFAQIQMFCNRKPVPCQVEQEISNLNIVEWRKKVVFHVELQPSQMNRFDCCVKMIPQKPAPVLKARNGKIIFKTKQLEVIINTKTGLVDKYKVNGINYVGRKAFEPIVMLDNEDSWEHFAKSFRKIVGRFKLMPKSMGRNFSGLARGKLDSVRIVEDGCVRSVIEAVFWYGNSFICQRYKLPKLGTEIELETRVYWNEKNRMLKLSIPALGSGCKYFGQVAYGVGELPCKGSEAVAQKWVAVVSQPKNLALTCINDGTYGSDFSDKGLRLTLLRSPAYSCASVEEGEPIASDRFSPRIDQGERIFKFWFNAGKATERLRFIDREALVKNERPFALSFFPSGQGRKPKPLAVLSDNVVQITTIKRAEKSNALIVRLYEPTGKSRSTVLSLPCLRRKIKVDLGGFEVKTLKINLKTRKYKQVDLLERNL